MGRRLTEEDLQKMRARMGGLRMSIGPPKNVKRIPTCANHYKSKLEEKRAGYLKLCQLAGEIQSWDYEPIRVKIENGLWYTPDFVIWAKDRVYVEETKGFLRPKDRARLFAALKVMKKFGIDEVYLIEWDGGWKSTRLI